MPSTPVAYGDRGDDAADDRAQLQGEPPETYGPLTFTSAPS
jgi:hypothetical protein